MWSARRSGGSRGTSGADSWAVLGDRYRTATSRRRGRTAKRASRSDREEPASRSDRAEWGTRPRRAGVDASLIAGCASRGVQGCLGREFSVPMAPPASGPSWPRIRGRGIPGPRARHSREKPPRRRPFAEGCPLAQIVGARSTALRPPNRRFLSSFTAGHRTAASSSGDERQRPAVPTLCGQLSLGAGCPCLDDRPAVVSRRRHSIRRIRFRRPPNARPVMHRAFASLRPRR